MKVGQTVYVKKVGNAARGRNKSELVSDTIVEKIGNKYFYLVGYNNKFGLDEMHDISDYSCNYCIYLTLQEILDEDELNELIKKIKKRFDYYRKPNLSLEQLRKIWDIIKG